VARVEPTIRITLSPFERIERCIRHHINFKSEERHGCTIYQFKRGVIWGMFTHDSLIACVDEAESFLRRQGEIE
jgi:hypothetical protein